MEKVDDKKLTIDEFIRDIYNAQMYCGGFISDHSAILNDRLCSLFGVDPDDGLDDNLQRVCNISSEHSFIVGFKMALMIKDLFK